MSRLPKNGCVSVERESYHFCKRALSLLKDSLKENPISFEREPYLERKPYVCNAVFGLTLIDTGWRRFSLDALSCTSLSAKDALIIGLFCGK